MGTKRNFFSLILVLISFNAFADFTIPGKLQVNSTTKSSHPCPSMTDAQMLAIASPGNGDCVHNTTLETWLVYNSNVPGWEEISGGGGGISLWVTGTPYEIDDVVIESDKIYRCIFAHTSGTFATDLASNYWVEVSPGLQSPVGLSDGGTGKSLTASNGAIPYSDADSFEILAPGISGQILQSNGSASPSWVNKSISAKSENNSAVTLEEIQVSNNQLTHTDTNKHLIETGNSNLLVNPSFEHSTVSTGWTLAAGSLTGNTTNEIHGLKAASISLSSETLNLTQDSSLYASEFAGSVQGLASVRIKTSVAGVKVCARQAGVTSSSLCVDVQSNNQWGLYKVPFILSATSNGIAVTTASAVTGTVLVDDAFVGAVDLAADVDQSKIAGESYFAGTTGCTWSRTSTTVGAFTATAACPGPTIVNTSLGSWQTTDSNLPRQTINDLPPGKYKATFFLPHLGDGTGFTAISISDGTTTCEPIMASNSVNTRIGTSVSCSFTYSASGNRTFEVFGGATAGPLNIFNDQISPRISIKFILEYFGSGSTYTSTNADTDWAACNFSTLAWQGLGTVTSNLQCKRQGSDLLMKGSLSLGPVSGVEARIPLPVWNGQSLITSSVPAANVAGRIARQALTNNDYSALVVSGQAYLNVSIYNNATAGPLVAQNGTTFATGDTISLETLRIPIAGWQNSNIIIGQFNGLETCTDTYQCTDVFSAKVSIAGIVSDENINWINGNASLSSAVYTMTFNSGVFTVAPNCTATTSTIGQLAASIRVESISPTQIQLVPSYAGGAGNNPQVIDQAFHIHCQKQGVDYIGKTAKAVASDQNIRTPGLTKSVLYSAVISTTGVVTVENGEFISGNCTNANPSVCTFTSNTFQSSPVCSATSNTYNTSVTSVATTSTVTLDKTTAAAQINLFCHGVSP
jgi:hypothetical protein